MNSERMAQLGSVEVSIAALDGAGAPLRGLLDPYHVDLPPQFDASGAPHSGWRVLPTSLDREDRIMLGAPLETGQWFMGQLTDAGDQWHFSVQGPVLRLPSRDDRRAGLKLRWPEAAADASLHNLFIDVLNTSTERWTATPADDFYTVGMLVAARGDVETPGRFMYAYVGGQSPAFILDPGEYARVHVDISANKVIESGVGQHLVYAAVPALNLRTEVPLTMAITPDVLDRAAPFDRSRPPRPSHR